MSAGMRRSASSSALQATMILEEKWSETSASDCKARCRRRRTILVVVLYSVNESLRQASKAIYVPVGTTVDIKLVVSITFITGHAFIDSNKNTTFSKGTKSVEILPNCTCTGR